MAKDEKRKVSEGIDEREVVYSRSSDILGFPGRCSLHVGRVLGLSWLGVSLFGQACGFEVDS